MIVLLPTSPWSSCFSGCKHECKLDQTPVPNAKDDDGEFRIIPNLQQKLDF